MTSDKNKRLKSLTDKNGVQTHRWVSDEDRGSSNADAVKRSSNPEVTMHTDPRSGARPLFDEDELAEEEAASGPPVYGPKGDEAVDEPEPDRLNGNGPPIFKPREGRAKEPHRLNGDGTMVYEVDYNESPGNDAQERVGGSGPPVYGAKVDDGKNHESPRNLNGDGPPVFETREQAINSRLDELIGDSHEFTYLADDGTPKTYRANATTETFDANEERRTAQRQERRDKWRSRLRRLFGRG